MRIIEKKILLSVAILVFSGLMGSCSRQEPSEASSLPPPWVRNDTGAILEHKQYAPYPFLACRFRIEVWERTPQGWRDITEEESSALAVSSPGLASGRTYLVQGDVRIVTAVLADVRNQMELMDREELWKELVSCNGTDDGILRAIEKSLRRTMKTPPQEPASEGVSVRIDLVCTPAQGPSMRLLVSSLRLREHDFITSSPSQEFLAAVQKSVQDPEGGKTSVTVEAEDVQQYSFPISAKDIRIYAKAAADGKNAPSPKGKATTNSSKKNERLSFPTLDDDIIAGTELGIVTTPAGEFHVTIRRRSHNQLLFAPGIGLIERDGFDDYMCKTRETWATSRFVVDRIITP